MERFIDKATERFLRYVKIKSMSSFDSVERPSTQCQFDIARELRDELIKIGASDVYLDEKYCLVYGTVPSTLPDGGGKSVAFIAHMDTIPGFPGGNVKPWIYENYQGGDVVLNSELGIVMKADEMPKVAEFIGEDVIFTDGTTLLGADDKAGIAEIMTMAEYFINNPQIPHGPIKVVFTPDEEIGGLARDLDFDRLNVDAAYTLDGQDVGTYTDETFNALTAYLTFKGILVHPGEAKDVMKNPVEMVVEFINMFPTLERPQHTEGKEGYYYPQNVEAGPEEAKLTFLIRDHDGHHFDERLAYIHKCMDAINKKYGENTCTATYGMSYKNMKQYIDTMPWLIEMLKKAIDDCGYEKRTEAFRGGTDGASISERGLPCPNISTGYEYCHGRYECISKQALAKCTEIIVKLVENIAKI